MGQVYVRRISRSTMYQKAPFCQPELAYGKLALTVACWFSSSEIDNSDYPKSLISRINELYVVFFSIKYRFSDILLRKHKLHFQPFVLLQPHLLLCLHGFCDVSVTL